MRKIICILIMLILLSSCSQGSADISDNPASGNNDVYLANSSEDEENNAESYTDSPDASAEYSISDYDNSPQSESIGVFYDGNFYGWVSQIKIEGELNAYIAQGEYIGESKEKNIAENNASDELPADGSDEWIPDSDFECNGLNAGTPLYQIDDYILAVYNIPVEYSSFTVHKTDDSEDKIGLYVYGHLYRLGE